MHTFELYFISMLSFGAVMFLPLIYFFPLQWITSRPMVSHLKFEQRQKLLYIYFIQLQQQSQKKTNGQLLHSRCSFYCDHLIMHFWSFIFFFFLIPLLYIQQPIVCYSLRNFKSLLLTSFDHVKIVSTQMEKMLKFDH